MGLRVFVCIIFAAFFLSMFPIVSLQASDIPLLPGTGDNSFDETLQSLNDFASQDVSAFINNLHETFAIPVPKIEHLIRTLHINPADVFMILGLADIIQKPFDHVLGIYQKEKGLGWGVMAKRLGIKPGSKQFHALKSGSLSQLDKFKGKDHHKKKGGAKNKDEDKQKSKESKGKKKGHNK